MRIGLVLFLAVLVLSLLLFLPGLAAARNPEIAIRRTLRAKGYGNNFIRFAIAQAKHETDSFRSPVFRNAKNLFGMKIPTRRDYDRAGTFGDYSAYNDYLQSANDYALYLKAVQAPKDFETLAGFVEFLKAKGYFEDSYQNYKNGLARFL